MEIFNKILIVLDVYHDFRDDPAHQPVEIRKAIGLIERPEQAQIYLVGCGFEEFLHDSYSNLGPDAVDQRRRFSEEMEQRLAVFAEALQNQGYKVECRVHWSYPRYEQIAREAAELGVDLVVQHVNTRQAAERHNLSHDSWQLIKTCPGPLLLVKDHEWPRQPVILAAVDPMHSHHKPSGLDHRILDTALHARQLLDGACHVVHACPDTGHDKTRQDHAAAMARLLADYELPEDAVHIMEASPVNAIIRCRESIGAGMVVLGALSRSRLAELIIGNTANRVLDYVDADLFIVRPE